jgi:hypothetical protein
MTRKRRRTSPRTRSRGWSKASRPQNSHHDNVYTCTGEKNRKKLVPMACCRYCCLCPCRTHVTLY